MQVRQQEIRGLQLPLVYFCNRCVYCPFSNVRAMRENTAGAQEPPSPFPLMELPVELRQRIYHFILEDIYPCGGINICSRGLFNGTSSFQPFKKQFVWQSYDGAIFRVSHTFALEMQDAIARYLPLRYSLNPRFDAFFHSAFTPLDARQFYPALARMRNIILNFPVNCNIDQEAHIRLDRFIDGLAAADDGAKRHSRLTVVFEELWFANEEVLAEAISERMDAVRLCLATLNKLSSRSAARIQLRYKFGESWTAKSKKEIEQLLINMGGKESI